MKKILTFLVMLLMSVSMLVAQEVKFPYQAVVRDMTNARNLVVNDYVDIEIQIAENGDPIFTFDTNNVQTNPNGLISILIRGTNEDFEMIDDWSNVMIISTFYKQGTQISEIQTPVTAVPYALRAENTHQELTTQQIVDYLSDYQNVNGEDVNEIAQALKANAEFSKAMKDSIFNYAKTQKDTAIALALHFLSQLQPSDLTNAINALTEDMKQAIEDEVVAYIKAHPAMITKVVKDYMPQITANDVAAVISAAKGNPQKTEIMEVLIDSALAFIKNHHDLIQTTYQKILDNTIIDSNDVVNAFNYVKTNRTDLYNFAITKFNGYLANYLAQNGYMKTCANDDPNWNNLSFCDIVAKVQTLQNSVNNCPDIESVEIRLENPPTTASGSILKIIYVDVKFKNIPANISLTTANVTCNLEGLDCLGDPQYQYENSIFTFRYEFHEGCGSLQNTTIDAYVELNNIDTPTGCSLPVKGEGHKIID